MDRPRLRASSLEAFLERPIGRYVVVSSSVCWCASPVLGGTVVWGAPDLAGAQAILHAFEALFSSSMAEQVDVIADGRRVERIDTDALAYVVEWNQRHRVALGRVRQQIGIVSTGLVGITLSGILPMVGQTHPFRIAHDPLEELRLLVGEGEGATIHREIEEIVEATTGVGVELRRLRTLLGDGSHPYSIAEAARALGLSSRSLQRLLAAHGTSFQREQRDARFAAASTLLMSTDEKIGTIAARVGVTEGALTQLFRERAGVTPSEFRATRR